MKNTVSKIILVLVLCSSAWACKEKFECTSNNYEPIPQIMKDYFFYKEGSWWVYKNIKNNTYDSMWISQNQYYNNRGEGNEGFGSTDKCYERIVMGIEQRGGDSISKFSMWDLSNFVVNNNNRFALGVLWTDKVTTANLNLDLFFVNNQIEKYNSVRQISSDYKDSTTVQNRNYYSLIEVIGADCINYWLFSKNIGLIKYIDRDSNQWELIKYNINQ